MRIAKEMSVAMVCFAALILFLFCVYQPRNQPAHTPIAFDFQGYRIGDPVTDEMLEKTTGDVTDGEASLYFDVRLPGYGESVNCNLGVIDSRIESISLYYQGIDPAELLAAFSDKFGPPHVEYSTGGYLWRTTDGDFYFGDGSAWIYSAKSHAASEKYQADKQQAIRDSLDGK